MSDNTKLPEIKNAEDPVFKLDGELTPFSPICSYCVHLISGFKRTCKAFPHGIPNLIWLGHNRHSESFQGDNGILFESIGDKYIKK